MTVEPRALLIPAPRRWAPAGQPSLPPRRLARVIAPADQRLFGQATFAALYLEPVLAGRPAVETVAEGRDFQLGGALLLEREAGLAAEGYRLRLEQDWILLGASETAGFSRGLATLYQMCAAAGPDTRLPGGVIEDEPVHAWRGLMLDSGRHFQPVATIKAVLDRMALLKLNVLHWHLTEDQGWRLELPGWPRLTEVGAWRATLDGGRYGGFYTADDVREIVSYAQHRGITVVPEIEMPGHCQAALAAYPELSCTGGPFEVQTMWGIHPDIYCAGNEDVFAFLESVLEHVLDLFPSPYIHVGGDEAPKERWRACPKCQARMAAEGLADEDALQAWFIRRMESWLSARGRRLVGWDEILEGDLAAVAPDATIQAWRGTRGAVAAVRAGLDAVVSPTSHAYFDYDVGILDLQQVHAFDPVPDVLNGDEPGRILGGAANLWSERVPPERVDAMLFPRLTAMAEVLWSAPAERDFAAFVDRVAALQPALETLGVRAGPAARPVVLQSSGADGPQVRLQARLADRVAEAFARRSTVLRRRVVDAGDYRPDLPVDRQPVPAVTLDDPEVREAFTVAPSSRPQLILVQAFVDGRPYGAPAAAEVRSHLALGRPAVFADAPSSRYPGGGAAGLTDGRFGSRDFKDGVWSGFEGQDAEAAIDLGAATPLRRLAVRALQNVHEWVFLPRRVRFYVSDDGAAWREAGTAAHDVSDRWQDPLIHEFACDVEVTARRIRVVAETFGPCPAWHPGAGQPTWIFLDEFTAD